MYKSLKRIVLLLAFVCVTLGLSVFALACNPEQDNGSEISAEYQALYEQYKEAAGENAKTLQDWYEALSADIEKIGDMGDIADMDVIEIENVNYVALKYENGRLFLEELLNGESFKEYSVFTLSPNAADQATITGIYLDVNRKGTSGAFEKVRSVRTGADGKVSVYLETDSQATYVVTIGEQSAEAYGFAPGYEPEFSGSQEAKTVAFSVQTASQKVTYTAKVVYRAEDYAPTKDVKLSLRYVESDAASLKVLGEGTTGEDGKLAISFYAHEDSKYEFVLDETSLTPDKYDPVEGPIEVDPEAEETVFTLIRLKNYSDPEILTPTGTAAKAEDPEDREPMALPIPEVTSSSAEWSTLYNYVPDSDTYTYSNSKDTANNGKQLFVAMDLFLERVHAQKTIKQLLEEGGYFTYEECVDEDQNTWAEHDYSKVLEAYMNSTTANGLYPLNNDLRQFIEAAAENGLFAQKTTDGKYDMFMPLVVYSDPKLIVGKEYTTTLKATNDYTYWKSNKLNMTVVPLMSNMEEGWYKLEVNSNTFDSNQYARIGGFTRDKSGLFEFGRSFTLTKTSGTTSNVNFEGVIYVGAGAKEICLMTGSYKYNGTYNLKLYLSKITAEAGTVAGVDVSALAGKKQQLLSPDKSEYEVLVYPESMLEQHKIDSNSGNKTNLAVYTNISTFGYTFDLDKRMLVDYTITPTVGDIQDLKIHTYTLNYTYSTSSAWSVTFTYTANEIKDDVTNCLVHAGDRPLYTEFDGVMFTHSGEDILTMKINVEAVNTQFTVTYKAGEGEGEDYTVGSGTAFNNKYTYYAPDANVTMLDNTYTKLGYTKEGYVFNGWSYEDAEGETQIVKPGEQVKMLDHDMVFTAVWREVSVNSTEPLTVGGSLEVDIDGKYTSVEIDLADNLEENKGYMLTISTGKNEWIWGFGSTRTIYALETPDSTETDHKYVAYFVYKADGDKTITNKSDKLIIDLSKDANVNFKATITLGEYTPVELKADGSEIIVPITFDTLDKDILYTTLEEGMAPGTYYFEKVDSNPGSNAKIYISGDLEEDDARNFGGLSEVPLLNILGRQIDLSATAKVDDGVEKIYFQVSTGCYGTAKVKIEKRYTITYRSSQEDVTTKLAPATPATDNLAYRPNAQATVKKPTLSSTFTKAYMFDYWKMVGDDSGKKYYGNETISVTQDITFEAVYVEVKEMIVNVDLNNKKDFVEGDGKLAIDPDNYTSCVINLSKADIRSGVILMLDLGSSNFTKEISTKIETPTMNPTTYVKFTHSDVLSSDGHNVYSSYFRLTSGSGSNLKLTVDLNAWKSAQNPALNDITVKAGGQEKVRTTGQSMYGKFFEEKDGKLQANGGWNSSGYSDCDFLFGLPSTVPGGHVYNVHVKFNVDNPQTTIGTVNFKNGSSTIASAMKYDSGSKEYTFADWDTSKNTFFSLSVSSSKSSVWYTCDVWLEEVS